MAWDKVSGLEGDVMALLRTNRLTVTEIVRVDLLSDPGSVLYLAGGRSAYTAWIWNQPAKAPIVLAEPGFVAEPSRFPALSGKPATKQEVPVHRKA